MVVLLVETFHVLRARHLDQLFQRCTICCRLRSLQLHPLHINLDLTLCRSTNLKTAIRSRLMEPQRYMIPLFSVKERRSGCEYAINPNPLGLTLLARTHTCAHKSGTVCSEQLASLGERNDT
jgi:hypothetical protein